MQKEVTDMNNVVTVLILVVSSIMLCCVVVNYVVTIFENYIGPSPTLTKLSEKMNNLEDQSEGIFNATTSTNQTNANP
jgi:hypothetical protein